MTITDPGTDPDGFFPKGPASVCIEGPPQRQCYTAPEDFGSNPSVDVVQLNEQTQALFFTAASGGVSGFRLHFALLGPTEGDELEDLFLSGISVSNQSQHAFWSDPAISTVPFFVTADFEWGPDEGHYGSHRFIISAYVRKLSASGEHYYLQDRYMTSRPYDLDADQDVLRSEKAEILARLRQVKLEESSGRKPQ